MGRKDYDQIVLELNTKQFSIIAGKELLNRLNSYVNQELSFIYETTLSDQSKYLENTIKEMKEKEWEIILIYIWVSKFRYMQRENHREGKERRASSSL